MLFSINRTFSFTFCGILSLCLTGLAHGENVFVAQEEGAQPTSWLANLYGKGLVISDPNGGFLQAEDNSEMRIVTKEEPLEYLSRFFVMQGPKPNVVFLRMSDFQYVCADVSRKGQSADDYHTLHVHMADTIPNATAATSCQFKVSKVTHPPTSPRVNASSSEEFLLQAVSSNRFVRLGGGKIYLSTSLRKYSTPFKFQDERDVIVDLGPFEQFLANGKPESEWPRVIINAEGLEKKLILTNREGHPYLREPRETEPKPEDSLHNVYLYSSGVRWSITRVSRTSNFVYIQSDDGDELCRLSYYSLSMKSDIDAQGLTCDNRFVLKSIGGGFMNILSLPNANYPTRPANVGKDIGTGSLHVYNHAGQATKFRLQAADSNLASMEIVDVEFDKSVTDAIPFNPDEVKIIKFRNDSPLEQQQNVELSEEKTITTETTWRPASFLRVR